MIRTTYYLCSVFTRYVSIHTCTHKIHSQPRINPFTPSDTTLYKDDYMLLEYIIVIYYSFFNYLQ